MLTITKRLEFDVKEQHLSDGVTWALEESELGQVLSLEVRVIRGKPFSPARCA